MLTKFKLTALFLFALFLSSCSNIGAGRDSSVTVSLGSDALKYLSARGAESEKTNDESTYFLTVSLKGDYSATQSAKISGEGASITFGEIPVESKIYAEGAVYKGNGDSEEKEVLYEGKSETIKISEGENSLSLVLKKIEKKFGLKKAPDAVGDIVFSDGSATPYSEDLNLTDEQKAAAVAVIFYVGNEDDMLGAKTLGVGIHQSSEKYAWAAEGTTGYSTEITDLEIATIDGETAVGSADEFQKDGTARTWNIDSSTFADGSTGWDVICGLDENASDTAETNYPAFHWCNTYGSTYSLSGYEDDWYMPTLAEFSMMYRVIDCLDPAILCTGGDKLLNVQYSGENEEEKYWTANQFPNTDAYWAYTFSFMNARAFFYYDQKNNARHVRAIRAFN